MAVLAARPCLAQGDPADPWEHTNRSFFNFQQQLDHKVFGPLSHGYGGIPSGLRKAITNFTRNLNEPLIMVNDLLQGHVGRAATTLGRFSINTIFGVAGIADVAAHGNIPYRENNFGLTLGRWGVGPGPYVYLPILGPSTVRDTFGSVVDIGLNPLNYVKYRNRDYVGAALVILGGLDERSTAAKDLETIEQTSTDPYATLRSYFLQNRAAQVADKPGVDIQSLPDFDDPGSAAPQAKPSPQADATPTSGSHVAASGSLLAEVMVEGSAVPTDAGSGQDAARPELD